MAWRMFGDGAGRPTTADRQVRVGSASDVADYRAGFAIDPAVVCRASQPSFLQDQSCPSCLFDRVEFVDYFQQSMKDGCHVHSSPRCRVSRLTFQISASTSSAITRVFFPPQHPILFLHPANYLPVEKFWDFYKAGLILAGMVKLLWNQQVTRPSISITTAGRNAVADYLSYRWLPELAIRQGQISPGFNRNPRRSVVTRKNAASTRT
jgi:hypothetical protein